MTVKRIFKKEDPWFGKEDTLFFKALKSIAYFWVVAAKLTIGGTLICTLLFGPLGLLAMGFSPWWLCLMIVTLPAGVLLLKKAINEIFGLL